MLISYVEPVSCLSASFFATAHGFPDTAGTLQHASAALLFAMSIIGWYAFAALVLLSVDFPYILPLGDLSNIVPGASQIKAKGEDGLSRVV